MRRRSSHVIQLGMRHAKEEPSTSAPEAIDLKSAVKELHVLSSQELNKLLRDSENFSICYPTAQGSFLKIDVEKLARSLPLHLIAVLLSSDSNEAMFRYLLCGIRLLHSLCDLAPRHYKLEQILLDDVKVSEQLMDLVFYVLIVLGGYRQEDHAFSHVLLVYSALVPCNLYLLRGFLSSQWPDLVTVLLAHPKVDIFIDAAFVSVRMVVWCLERTLSSYQKDIFIGSNLTSAQVIYCACQYCEASVQFLQSLCKQKLFMERLLKNKDLCGKGGVLFLAESILKLNILPFVQEDSRIVAAISRLKAKIISILLLLCDTESTPYLDEVAKSPQSLNLAKSVVLQVLDLLKTVLGKVPGQLTSGRSYPMGLLQLNAMRLADILSDDSNFRSYITICFTEFLAATLSLSHRDFISCWCSSSFPEKEVDATLEYDIFTAAGWVLDTASLMDSLNVKSLEINLIPNSMDQASYAHQRSSLFVKVIANLHCFVPDICKEQERKLFLLKVMECLQMDLSYLLPGFSFASDAQKAATACKNLDSLLKHAESLIPMYLSMEDLQLLRLFFGQVQSQGENHIQAVQCVGGCSAPLIGKEPTDLNKSGNIKQGIFKSSEFHEFDQVTSTDDINQCDDLKRQDLENKGILGEAMSGGARDIDKDAQNVDASAANASSAKAKNVVDHIDNVELSKREYIKKVGESLQDEVIETVQRRKRRRNIMNDKQVALIESALLDEPEMQRNATSLQLWADKLGLHGSEVTPSQLKNWLNNRKARIARTARDVQAAADAANPVPDKQRGPVAGSYDLPNSPKDASNASKDSQSLPIIVCGDDLKPSLAECIDLGPLEFVPRKAGQYVALVGVQGEKIGKGMVFQVHGKWQGKSLEESRTCVVDVFEFSLADKGMALPYPSEAAGSSFAEAETKLGLMRVLWDSEKTCVLRSE